MNLKTKIELLTKALEFYADPKTYQRVCIVAEETGKFLDDFSAVNEDIFKPGKLARETLAKIKNG